MPIRLHASLTPAGAFAALAVLAEAESHAAAELVDEGERQRLHELSELAGSGPEGAQAMATRHANWRPFIAELDDARVGYAGLLLPEAGTDRAVAELVVVPAARRHGVGTALLAEMSTATEAAGGKVLSVWARDDDASRAFATTHACEVDRRLDGLGRTTRPVGGIDLPSGVRVRPYRPTEDDAGIVEALVGAFVDNPDSAWTLEGLQERRRRPWFRPDGVFVAVDDEGTIGGVHITKDRGAKVGEVHLLAVHPREHGRGLGRALLRAGLRHLQEDLDVDDVILWMEHDNKAARRLYESEGFDSRWSDVSYAHRLT